MTFVYPPMPDGPVIVTRDGEPVTDTLKNADEAFVWLLRNQYQSVGYALQYDGYAVVPLCEELSENGSCIHSDHMREAGL